MRPFAACHAFVLFCLLSLAGAAPAQVESLQENEFQVGNLGVMKLLVPAGWVPKVLPSDGGRPVTLLLRPAKGPDFQVLMTPVPPRSYSAILPTPEFVRQRVELVAARTARQSVEPRLVVQDLSGDSVFGAYFSATDKAPAPGEFRFMTQGMLSFGELLATFTILTNEGQEGVVAAAMRMMRSASFRANP